MTSPPVLSRVSSADIYSEDYQDPALTSAARPPSMSVSQQLYEVPGEEDSSMNRQYSVLQKQGSEGSSIY